MSIRTWLLDLQLQAQLHFDASPWRNLIFTRLYSHYFDGVYDA